MARIILDDKKLPWVPSLQHLGMTIESNNSMALDIELLEKSKVWSMNSAVLQVRFYYEFFKSTP